MPTIHRLAARSHAQPSSGRTVARVILTIMLSCTLVATPAVAQTTEPASPGSSTKATASPAGAVVRGTLERVIVEADDRTHHSGAATPATTWLRTTISRIPLEDDAVRGIPTGSTIAVQLAIPRPSPDASPSTDRPRAVSSVSVLSRASTTPRTTATAAVHSITVVLALPTGNKPDKVTAASLTSIVNGGVSRFWSQESDGRISFKVSKAVGWTKLSSSCANMWAVWDEVQRRIGFVPGQRRHLVIYAPPSAGCPTGLATVGSAADVGGNVTVGGTTTSLIAHELGHNLGLGHSEALTCSGRTDAVITAGGFGPNCHQIPYGDWYDVMGISWENLGSLSTAHAFRLGLLSATTVATARGPLRVTLRPVSTRVGVRTLRVVDPSGSTYVIEYRPASGADAWLSTSADWRGLDPGVLLRRINPEDPTQTLLLDPTPSTSSSNGDIEVALPAGRTVTTASGRVSIVVESVSANAVTVAVAMNGVWPALVVEPRGRLIDGRQVTIGQALAEWGAQTS